MLVMNLKSYVIYLALKKINHKIFKNFKNAISYLCPCFADNQTFRCLLILTWSDSILYNP